MEIKKRLLFVNQRQFGYHNNYFEYCKYLKGDFDLTYLCWDYGSSKIFEEDVNVIYIPRKGNILKRHLSFIISIISHLRIHNYDKLFINYFTGCSIIPIIFNRKYHIHLNIVTGSVSVNTLNRKVSNIILLVESHFFQSVSIISKGLRKLLQISRDATILPLGSKPLIINRKSSHKVSMLYVGTFSNRRIQDTIHGLGLFFHRNPEADIIYTIIGRGIGNEVDKIKEKIDEFGLGDLVDLKGYIHFSELIKYYEEANVGVSFIPMTSFYEYQPPTKTFEYLMSGIPVIATDTYENRQIINVENGILIEDNAQSFALGISYIYDNITLYNEQIIRASVSEYNLETIVNNMRKTILR